MFGRKNKANQLLRQMLEAKTLKYMEAIDMHFKTHSELSKERWQEIVNEYILS